MVMRTSVSAIVPPYHRKSVGAPAGVWWASVRRDTRRAGTWRPPRATCATASSARPPARVSSTRSSLSPRPAAQTIYIFL